MARGGGGPPPGGPPGALAVQAKMFEAAGLEGLFAPQVYGPPFVPLAAAASVTERVRLASGIALAFVRSPFETAMTAIDLDRISGGAPPPGPGGRGWGPGAGGCSACRTGSRWSTCGRSWRSSDW